MIDYTGIKCPICGKPFVPGDDIVVCPDCGAPYHRACYLEEGKCKFADKHGTDEAWKRPESPERPDTTTEIKDRECPYCGKLNAHSALFCDQCGHSLSGGPAQYRNTGYQQPDNQNSPQSNQNSSIPFYGGFPGSMPPGTPMTFAYDPLGGVQPNEPIGEIPAAEVAKFVQNNTAYYIPTFVNQKSFKKNRFNFSAFLFAGGWMLYRKQYKFGAILTSVMAALYIAYVYISSVFSLPILQSLYSQLGIAANTAAPTYQQSLQMFDILSKDPSKMFLFFAPVLIMLIQLGIMLFVGFNGNRMYLNHCLRSIHDLRSQNLPIAEYNVQLQNRGGINAPLTICLLVCYLIITWLPTLL